MAPGWYEYAEKCTSSEEHLKRNYDGKLDGEYGHLMISDKKLLFVKEEGFFKKKYTAPFLLSYDKVREVRPIDKYMLQISDKTGITHKFLSHVSASRVNEVIHDEMKSM